MCKAFRDIQHVLLFCGKYGAKPLAILCLGPVEEFYPAPMLVLEGWAQARPLSELLYENYWGVRQ